jgi:hypothetical protein
MNDYKHVMKRLENRRKLCLALAFIPALMFPIAFELITRYGGYIALAVGLFYAITGFLALYLAERGI